MCTSAIAGWSAGKKYGLAEPGWNSLGGIGVAIGLGFVIHDIAKAETAAREATRGNLKQGLLQ